MNRRLIICLCFFLVFLSISAQNIKLVFRYDDFILKSDSLDEGVIRIFQKHHIPLVLGVIPCDSREKLILQENYSFLPFLKKAIQDQSIEIALHGLTHGKFVNGEFGNLKKEEQFRRIHKAKVILDSIFQTQIVTFIPPWNAYDDNTLDVIEKNGMKGISSALCIGQPWSNSHISYFPETIEDFGSLTSVLKHNENRNGVVVVMFHHYTFKKGYTLSYLDSLLTSIKLLKHVQCVSFQQLYEAKEKSNGKRMNANMESNLLYKYLHLQGMIQTTSFAFWVRVLNVIVYMVWCLIIYLLSLLLINQRKKIDLTRKELLIGSLLLIFVGFSVYLHVLAPIKLLFVLTIFSVLLPLLSRVKLK